MKLNLFLASDIGFGEACLYSLVAIVGVFLILILITVCVNLLKYIKTKEDKEEVKEVEKKIFSAADIKDDDMMVATLVASIAFYDEKKQNAKCVNVKEIK